MIMGALVFTSSFLGIFGAAVEEKRVISVYVAIATALVIVQIAIAVIGLSGMGNISAGLEKTWDYSYNHHPSVIRNAEETYECCGFRNFTDRAYPKSTLDACIINPDFGYHRSCFSVLHDEFNNRQYSLGVAGMVLAIVQGITLVPTFYMLRRLNGHVASAGERTRLLG